MTPKYLLGTATLIWGIQADLLWFAIPMALILEYRFYFNRRWALTQQDFYRVGDLTTLGMAGLLLFLFLNARTYHFITSLIQWLPIVFYSLAVVHDYSTTDRMRLDVLFHSLRKQKEPTNQFWDMDYFFLGTCLLATGINTNGDVYYFPYVAAMICWALYPMRKLRYANRIWGLLVCCVFLSGNMTHALLQSAQDVLEKRSERWIANWLMQRTNPLKNRTALGQVGQLKLSDAILFRIKPEGDTFPRLIKEASYDWPDKNDWTVSHSGFETIPHTDDFTWRLQDPSASENSATVFLEFDRRRALIPVPAGVSEIHDLPALDVKLNRYGTVQGADLIPSPSYQISYRPDVTAASGGRDDDLYLPQTTRATLSRIGAPSTLTPQEAVDWAKRYFGDFRYTLYQRGKNLEKDPLSAFLFEVKAGHCEYFASATALLLRQMGVHGRYVVGYSVQEYSPGLQMYVVRQRHAHAWAEAYVNNRWQPVDTTPGIWLEAESDNAGLLQPLWDALDNGSFMFGLWWNDQKIEDYQIELFILALMLAAVLFWRIYTSEQVLLAGAAQGRKDLQVFPGADSPFFDIEKHFEEKGMLREPGELLSTYLGRINHLELLPLLQIHVQWRFDPLGISDKNRILLSNGVNEWLTTAELSSAGHATEALSSADQP